MEELIKRENEIFYIIQAFLDNKLDFIVVGGYAVSAFKHRFSVDADIVIESNSLNVFESILKDLSFKKVYSKNLDNFYSSSFIRYEKDKTCVDLMIGALASRGTNASFSYNLLLENSIKKKIVGSEKEVFVRIPIKEILIVMKLHSGRLTDFRDIAALSKDINLDVIKKFLFVGDLNKVNENLKKLNAIVNDKKFVDSFKGVFIEKKFDIDFSLVKKISELRK